jgi:hypothetical protein
MKKLTYLRYYSAAIFLGVLICSGYANPVLAQISYSDQVDHYSFTLPSGWEEIPQSFIDQYADAVASQTQTQRNEYAAGFHLSENDYFQHPYILVQEYDVNTPSYASLEKEFSSLPTITEKKTGEYTELVTSATAEKPFMDKERGIVFMNMQADVANLGKINALSALFLGKQGITAVYFYSLSSEYSRWLPVFNSIIESFRYNPDYAYNPKLAEKKDPPSLFENVVEKIFSGAIIGGFFGILITLIVSVKYFITNRSKK